MSKTIAACFILALIAAASAQTSCSTMFTGLKCRTASQDPSKVDAGSVSSARGWLCSTYPQTCSAINAGGQYASCNTVEQLSYAMNIYYNQFQSQGPSACNFGGIGNIVNTVATSSSSSTVTPATTASSSTVATSAQCQAMYSQASCRTASEDPSQVDAGTIAGSRGWLCSTYPQFCTAINAGGAYASCNSVEQMTYAMSLYYNQFQSQGSSACSFGGIGFVNSKVNTPSSTSSSTPTPTTVVPQTTATVDCTAMFNNLKCRTVSQNPAAISASGLSNARSWLCSNYGSFCTAINAGGQYASCNSAEQLSYAINQYYQQNSFQGASACSFGGIGQIVSSGSGVVVAPAPAPTPISSKAGLAWPINQFNDGTNPPLAPWAQGKMSWIYTWASDFAPLPISSSNLEWVPMLHSQAGANDFIAKIQSGAYDNVKNMLLFNEPDLNYPPYAYALDVNTAISITLQVFQAIRQRGISPRVGTPAMSYNMNYLQQYLAGVNAQCPTCKFSFVPVHMYTTDSNAFKNNVQNYWNTFGLPIWVTEFAQTDFNNRNYQMSLGQVQQFMSDTTNWLNAQSWVERFSWFGVMRAVDVQDKQNMAMNMDGSRNTVGDQYVLRGGSL